VFPAQVAALEKITTIDASDTHSISINSELKLFSFGINSYGELGNGKAGVQALVRVRLAKECKVVNAKCGNGFTVALIRGNPPDTVASASYAAPKKDTGGSSKDDFSKLPSIQGGVTMDESMAEAKIAELLNTFKIKPQDPKTDRYQVKYNRPPPKSSSGPPPPGPPDDDDDGEPLPPPPDEPPPEDDEDRHVAEEHQVKIGKVTSELQKKLAQDAMKIRQGQNPNPYSGSKPTVISSKPSVSVMQQPKQSMQQPKQSMQQPKQSIARNVAPSVVHSSTPSTTTSQDFELGGPDPDLPPEPEFDQSPSPTQQQQQQPTYQEEQQPEEQDQPLQQQDEPLEDQPLQTSPQDLQEGEMDTQRQEEGGEDLQEPSSPVNDGEGGDSAPKKEKKKKKKELPPGWKKVKDPKSGRSYYYNTVTRETTWKRPKLPK